jgi:hypothetical protein
MITEGLPLKLSSVVSPPRRVTSSSWTILVTIWAGVTELKTSLPSALARTRSMKPATTSTLTSASSKASLISRKADSMWNSVR